MEYCKNFILDHLKIEESRIIYGSKQYFENIKHGSNLEKTFEMIKIAVAAITHK